MRLYTLTLSILAHVVAVGGLIVVPLFATHTLPEPPSAVEFIHPMPAIIAPPPLKPRTQPTPTPATSDAAPLEAPSAIEPEPAVDPTAPIDPAFSTVEGIPLVGDLVSGDPPPPPARPQEPVRPGGLISRPERIRYVAPDYPHIARVSQIQGTVILEAVIGTDGLVREARVLKSIPLLDAAALAAVQQWQFTPTLLNGQAVPVVMTVTVVFSLR